MLDALAYMKAARAYKVPAALRSRSQAEARRVDLLRTDNVGGNRP